MENTDQSEDVQGPENPQDIFEKQMEFYFNEFQNACVENDAPCWIAIVQDKNLGPVICGGGHIYDQAVLITKVLRQLKRQMNKDLTI